MGATGRAKAIWDVFIPVQFFHMIAGAFKNPRLRGRLYAVAIILLLGTYSYMRTEGWNFLDSFYFSVITLTTVGYGDLAPQTDAGKMFTVMYIFVGLGLILSFVQLIAEEAHRKHKK